MAYGKVDQVIDSIQLVPLIDRLNLSPLTTQQAEGNPLHHFVRGLIFSAELVDIVSQLLSNGCHAAWGQLVDDDGKMLSPENDIILYRGTAPHTWHTSSFKYSLVRSKDCIVVIQCRAIVKGVGADLRRYASIVKAFCPRVWLFAECCWAKSPERSAQIVQDARSAGYECFWYLYDYSHKDDITPNRAGWHQFKQAIARAMKPSTGRKRKPSRHR